MPKVSQKKSEQVLVMLVPDMFEQLRKISQSEDRPVGYVARELMIRGLALYEMDGKLRGDVPGGVKATEITLNEPKKKGQVVGGISSERATARSLLEQDKELLSDVSRPKKRRAG